MTASNTPIIQKRRKPYTPFDIALVIVCILLAFLFVYPIYYIFVAAFAEPADIFSNPIIILPRTFSLYNMQMMFSAPSIWVGYRNTVFYMCLGTVINVSLTMLLAYALAQKELPARRVVNFLVTFTMFFSGGMIPIYLVVKELGLLNTIWAIVLPGAISTWNLLITRTYLDSQIPHELMEAAYVDGAGEYRVFFQIVLPLAKPIIITIAMFYASAHWNAWFGAMIYLRDRRLYPLQIFMRELLIQNDASSVASAAGDYGNTAMYVLTMKYAVMVASVLPLLLVFPFAQKYFEKGIMIGALKG